MARIIGASSSITPITRDTANLRIGVNSATPSHTLDARGADAAEVALIRNTAASGLAALVCKDDGGTSRVSFGYGNASYADADLRRSFVWLQSSDFSITDGTTHFVAVDRANARVGINTSAPGNSLDVRDATTGEVAQLRNTNAAGLSAVVCKDDGGTARISVGYGNASYADADLRSAFVWLQSSNFTITDGTTHFVYVDRANTRMGFGTAVPARPYDFRTELTGGTMMGLSNTHNAGYSAILFTNESVASKSVFGYGNASVALAPYQGRTFLRLVADDFIISDDTNTFLYADRANTSLRLLGFCDGSKQGNVQTTDATVTTLLSFTPTADRTVVVKALIAGRRSDDAAAGGYEVTATFRVTSGAAVTQVGATTAVATHEDDGTWAATLDTDGSLIRIRVTGVAGTTIRWTGAMRWLYGAN
jgi:hypothetical protein